jgi:hypothetical protein
MLCVTFDTNLLIDLEEERAGFEKIQKIIDLHNSGRIKLCIPAIIASEKRLTQKHISNYDLFEEYLGKLCINDYEELMPISYWEICFWGHGLWAGPKLIALDHLIHKILFPNIEPEYQDFCKSNNVVIKEIHQKWRNAKIDVQMLWCHVYHKKDVFITRDGNFKKHLTELSMQISQIKIMNPNEFLEQFENLPGNS